jgi:hypothetical protein
MSSLHVRSMCEVLPELPDIRLLEPCELPLTADLFICALGFEPRCTNIAAALSKSSVKARVGIYCEPSTNQQDNRVNLPSLLADMRGFCEAIEVAESDSIGFADRLVSFINLMCPRSIEGRHPTVLLDISVFSNRALLRTMKVMLEADVLLVLLYSEAAIYHPTLEEYQREPAAWKSSGKVGLEHGVSRVEPSREHPGQHWDPLPDFLVLFPSFRADRTRAVISRVDPSLLAAASEKLFWLIGRPHAPQNGWRKEAMREINQIGPIARQCEVNTFDYKDALERLESIYREMSERYNLTVSPLGSKLQSIGLSLFCYLHPDVRVMVSAPKEYNAANFSEGCVASWMIEFGFTGELRSRLELVGTLSIGESLLPVAGAESLPAATEL